MYIPMKVKMILTLWKPCVMFPLNFLALLIQLSLLWKCHMWYLLPLLLRLSLLWRCHLWYLYSLFSCLYNCWHYPYLCWHYKWFHFAFHHFLCPYIYALMFPLIPKREAPPSSTMFFFLKTFFGEFVVAFFLFFNASYISSLVL
jgi:hypothetical protein